MNMTDEQLDDIEARANAATEGPWFKGHYLDIVVREDVPALVAEVRRLREKNRCLGYHDVSGPFEDQP